MASQPTPSPPAGGNLVAELQKIGIIVSSETTVVVSMEDPDRPPSRLWDREPSFEKATCKRTLCPDGTLWEVVRLDKIGEDGDQPTDEELNRWIAGFPIEPLRTWHSQMTAL